VIGGEEKARSTANSEVTKICHKKEIETRKSVVFVIALFMAIAFAACQTPAGRSAGEVVDDASITTQVKAKLLEDSVTKGLAVTVQTFEGTVTLIGAVDTEQQKAKAAEVAYSVKGVKKVNNLVTLKK
jgi:hyperosmotically inducible protein